MICFGEVSLKFQRFSGTPKTSTIHFEVDSDNQSQLGTDGLYNRASTRVRVEFLCETRLAKQSILFYVLLSKDGSPFDPDRIGKIEKYVPISSGQQ